MLRLLTWNTHRCDSTKMTNIKDYMQREGIHYAFIQEGAQNLDNDESESALCQEYEAINPEATYPANYNMPFASPAESDKKGWEKIFATTYAAKRFRGLIPINELRVSNTSTYNLFVGQGQPTPRFERSQKVAYESSLSVMEWLYHPIKGKVRFSMYEDGVINIGVNKGSKTRYPKKKPREKWLIASAGSRGVALGGEAAGVDEAIRPVKDRAGLIGCRRPASVVVSDSGKDLRVFYWHAPLGSGKPLGDEGFGLLDDSNRALAQGARYSAIPTLDLAANLLFKKFLYGTQNSFPDDTILLGDLNIKAAALPLIYGSGVAYCSNSIDNYCHVIVPRRSAQVTLIDNSAALRDALGGSDHTPLVVEITFQ